MTGKKLYKVLKTTTKLFRNEEEKKEHHWNQNKYFEMCW
jgi:hypothetical protein